MRDREGNTRRREKGAGRKCREVSVMPHTQMRKRGTETIITVQGFGTKLRYRVRKAGQEI